MNMLEAAQKLAKMGKPVFPCNPNNKAPLTLHGFNDASTDFEKIEKWWTENPNAMIGMPTGMVSGYWVVDCDGSTGIKNFERLCSSHNYTPETRVQDTPSNGRHYFFKWPKEASIPNSVSKLAEKVDVRGAGGYVILAPSQRNDSRKYKWRLKAKIKAAPSWLEKLALAPKKRSEQFVDGNDVKPANYDKEHSCYVKTAIHNECAKVAHAATGQRNDTLNKASYSLGQLVGAGIADESSVRRHLEKAANVCGLTRDDGVDSVLKTINSGLSKGKLNPRNIQLGTSFDPEWKKTNIV